MEIDLVVTPGLGDNSYVISSGGEAVVVDPQRDAERFLEVAERRGARIRSVLETHVHNDYVSGASELRAATGAEIAGPGGAGYAFAFRAMADGDALEIGGHRLEAIGTAGHTPEHVAYLLTDDERSPIALLSGGSLIVGAAGRTDLLGPERTDELTRAQHRSVQRLAELPDDVLLLPTHGAGSFCAIAPPSDARTSTIGDERASNPALSTTDEEAFVTLQLRGLPAFPSYYAHMAPINRSGPDVHGSVPTPPGRTAEEIERAMRDGTWVVDGREGASFAAAHVPGSLNVPLEASFASYVGWLVPFGADVALVLPEGGEALEEAAVQLFRIGYDRLGRLEGGVDAWRASGRSVSSYQAISPANLAAELGRGGAEDVVDVRQRTEWDAGHIEGSRHVFVGDVPNALGSFSRDRTTTFVCASGYRSSMAASLLAREGAPVRVVTPGGVPHVLRRLRR